MSAARTIFDAVKEGDVDGVRALLDADPALASAKAEGGVSPLMTALYHGKREVADAILERRPPLDAAEAAAAGDVEVLRARLEEDPDAVRRQTADGWTPLHLAAFFGRLPALRLLLERGAEVNARSTNPMKNLPLHAAMAGPLGTEGIRLLLDAGAEVNATQHGGYTALHSAAMHGDPDVVRLLRERGADSSLASDDGSTAADFARRKGHEGVLDLL